MSHAALDDLFEADKCAAADEKNAGCVNPNVFLLRMLATALRRNVADGAFQYLKQRLLHTFPRDIASQRDILGLAGNLIDFIDVNDTPLGAFHVIISVLEQA